MAEIDLGPESACLGIRIAEEPHMVGLEREPIQRVGRAWVASAFGAEEKKDFLV